MIRLCFIVLLSAYSPKTFAGSRATQTIDADWRFFRADFAGAELPATSDQNWAAISLPHTWNAEDGQRASPYYRGVGWYRHHMTLATSAGSHTFLRFGAASLEADVFLNGHFVGHHDGGFTAFTFDITPHIQSGDNLLAVRVTNARNPHVAPLDADFTFFGGLYRSVSLITTPAAHIDLSDYGSGGVYAHTSAMSASEATIVAIVKLKNEGQLFTGPLRLTLTDSSHVTVASAEKSLTLAAGLATETLSIKVPKPHLWQGVKDPYLYRLHVDFGGDAVDIPFGIRQIRFEPNSGFFLNGQALTLNGVAMHQDLKGKGWALNQADRVHNADILTALGANAVRLCHYPHAPEELDLLDQRGLVAWSEIPLVNTIDSSPEFARVSKQQLVEMIRQQYNHPSVILWGLFNEVKADPFGLVAELNTLAHNEDGSRPTAGATDRPLDFPLHPIPDLLAFNKYDGWYYRTLPDFGFEMDAAHGYFPMKPLGVSEYGAGANVNHHQDPPSFAELPPPNFHPEERQNVFHESYLSQLRARPYVFAHFVWNLFDFAAANRNEGGQPGLNDKGLVTYDHVTKKDAFFLYQSSWSPEPTLYITSRRFTKRTQAAAHIKVYSNTSHVSVRLNGKSLGLPSRHEGVIWDWDVTLAAGENSIDASGDQLTDSVSWTLSAPP